MKLIITGKLFALMFLLSACQVTTFSKITEGVRTAVTYEDSSKKKVVTKTIEMLDARTGKWFEAERKADGTYTLTPAGLSARQNYLANEESGSGGY